MDYLLINRRFKHIYEHEHEVNVVDFIEFALLNTTIKYISTPAAQVTFRLYKISMLTECSYRLHFRYSRIASDITTMKENQVRNHSM